MHKSETTKIEGLLNNKIFYQNSCLVINISINTHENNSCPRGEIGRHKGLKSLGIENFHCLIQSHSVLNYY